MGGLDAIKTILTVFPYAFGGSIVAGMLCSYLGVYIVSKRVVFVGATLTQVAVAGIAFAHLPNININPAIGSVVFTMIAVVLLSELLRVRFISRDAVLGIGFVIAIAARILMIQKSPAAEASEIESLLKGDILFVTAEQFYLLMGVFVLVMAIFILFKKEFLFVSFDPDTAQTQGFHARWWELLFYVTAAIAISVATRIVGDVFVIGFLILPSAAALLSAQRVNTIFRVSALLAIAPPAIGLYLAFTLDLPAGPTAVAVEFAMLVLGWVFRRVRAEAL
jgi:ABC-type Mn2+/Zn2+ transport system permease subunit